MTNAIGPNSGGRGGLLARLAPWVLILGLVALHAINNWIWLTKNVVIPGWDRPAHLGRSLAYYATLTPPSWQGLFQASVQDPIRPPLFFASVTPLYWAFGTSSDVAIMVNVGYWLILIASVYGLGAHLGGKRLGVWGAVLAALVPLLYGMSRSFYIEFSLAALVTLTLYLLVASDGLRQRGYALAFGVALGLGMLTKRTYLVFVVVPVVLVILRSEVLRSLWNRLRGGLRISVPDLLVATGGGVALAALWYFPNRGVVQDLTLGLWLFPAWAVLIATTIYLVLRRPRDPGVNCLSALGLGATIASLWYLPRVEVVRRLLLYGYGVGDPRGRELDLTSIYTYTYYLRHTTNEGLGLVFALLLVVAVVGIVAYLIKKGRVWRTIWEADNGWWVLFLWPLAAYVLLTFSIYKEARAFTPVLPALALIVAAGLVLMPWRWLGRALLGLTLIWGIVQFAVISYSEFSVLAEKTRFWSDQLGDAGLFAHGVHLELPDAGETDPGYHIQPDVLARMDARRRLMERDSVRLGVLAHTPQINAGSFLYATLTRLQDVEVADLAPNHEGGDPLPRLYGYEYLLLTRDNQDPNAEVQAAIERILDDPPRLFQESFVLETTYSLPDGDTAYLYYLQYWPDPTLPGAYVAEAREALSGLLRSGDALILSPPELLPALSREGIEAVEIYLLPDQGTVGAELADITREHRRVFVLFGHAGGESEGFIEAWLNQHAYRADDRWFGSLQLALFGTTAVPPAEQATQMRGARFGDGVGGRIELTGIDLAVRQLSPGDVVPLTLFWRANQPIERDLKVFVHLLNAEGQLVAQRDSQPVGGMRPTSTWQVDEPIVDRYGVLLPGDLLPGEYQLIAGLYDPVSGERLLVRTSADAAPEDHLVIGTISVGP
jgi:4-amino-4-deoxy-L-arabinose transferase-like glycosyltransferase